MLPGLLQIATRARQSGVATATRGPRVQFRALFVVGEAPRGRKWAAAGTWDVGKSTRALLNVTHMEGGSSSPGQLPPIPKCLHL